MEITTRQLLHGYRVAHQRFRAVLEGLSEEQLNWAPHPEANSIAALLVHTIGSERWNLRAVRGLDNPRDREAEFRVRAAVADLVALLDAADSELQEHEAGMDPEQLGQLVATGREPELGIHLLLANTGHAREHAAQAELTRQLVPTAPSGRPD